MEPRKLTYDEHKQLMIIRQSQLKLVLDWAISCGYCLSLSELTRITNQMTTFVEEGSTPEVNDIIKGIDKYLESKNEKTNK